MIFFDGSGNDLDLECGSGSPAGAICETNIAEMFRLAVKDGLHDADARQVVFYEYGVGSARGNAEGDSFATGLGVEQHALKRYHNLAEHYEPGDRVFVFGFSRGTLSARYLQGMIDNVGLAHPGHSAEAERVHRGDSKEASDDFLAKGNTHTDVVIHFMGLYDGVLRTLFHPIHHLDTARFRLNMTARVRTLRHAIALDEIREVFQANEIAVDPSTDSQQVWFMGSHADVGGGFPNKGPAHIALGWMADAATAAGLLLAPGWAADPATKLDYLGELHLNLHFRRSLMGDLLQGSTGYLQMRNPGRCRAKAAPFRGPGGSRIKIHQSVRDREQVLSGWVPLPWCCGNYELDDVEWVTNPHYDRRKTPVDSAPKRRQWIRVKFGRLQDIPVGVDPFVRFYITVQPWHSSNALPDGEPAPEGYSSPITVYPKGDVETSGRFRRTASVDFGGEGAILPYRESYANMVIAEVWEQDRGRDDFEGRALLNFGAPVERDMVTHAIGSGGGSLEVQVEYFSTDDEAKQAMGWDGPAQCEHEKSLAHHTQTWDDLCGLTPPSFAPHSDFQNAHTCEGFIEDITSG